ncbi:MAG: hypothetical protein ABUT11_04690, partial [Leifsonia sp.]
TDRGPSAFPDGSATPRGVSSTPPADRHVAAPAADLDSGEWDRRFGVRSEAEFDGSLRLIVD